METWVFRPSPMAHEIDFTMSKVWEFM
jgi:hypothetical protein